MTEVKDYAPAMTALYAAYKSLDEKLRDKAPQHDCLVLCEEIIRKTFRVVDYVKADKERG